jgi:PAS domain S-box-containing protein
MTQHEHIVTAEVVGRSKGFTDRFQRLRERMGLSQTELDHMAPQELRELIHRLMAHIVTLEPRHTEQDEESPMRSCRRARGLRHIVEHVDQGICQLDEHFAIVYANHAFTSMLGIAPEKLRGHGLTDFIVPDDHQTTHEMLAGCQEDTSTRECELRFCPAAHEAFTARIRLFRCVRDDGKTGVLTAVCTDITDRIVREKERGETQGLREQMQRAREELSSRQQALEAVYAMTTAFSGSLEALFDQVTMTISAILDLPFVVVLHIKDSKALVVAQMDEGILERPKHILHDCPLLTDLGSRRSAYHVHGDLAQRCAHCVCLKGTTYPSHIGVPILGPHGELVGAICAFDRCDTPFGDYERHLIEIFARYLSHEVSRVRMEEQLRQSNEMKLLGQLTSGVAHEVRNPLNAIAAITEAIFVELDGQPEFAPYKLHIDRQVGRLSALMEDLLMLGRPVREESMRPISLWKLVSEVVGATVFAPEEQSAEINVTLPDESKGWHVLGDNLKLNQVLVNLLENARQHSPAGESVLLVVDRPAHETTRLRIVDAGSGIHPDNLSRIFEPFFTTRKSGTGLGLSIVRRIVESHGGSIELFNNDPPPGLTAEIRLPLVIERS